MLSNLPVLTLISFSPLLGILLLLMIPKKQVRALKAVGITAAAVPLLLSLWLFVDFEGQSGGSYEELATWAEVPLNHERLGGVSAYLLQIQYHMGIDGLSLPLVLLTALVSFMAALASVYIKKRWKAFYLAFLLLETSMLGVFMARDLFLFFIFLELTFISVFFLLGIWGNGKREQAANRFLIYNGIGSVLLLTAFVMLISTAGFHINTADSQNVIYYYSGSYDVLLANLGDPEAYVNLDPDQVAGNPFYMSQAMQNCIFILLVSAFGIMLPIFPAHRWMLQAHVEAPSPISMVLAGVLLKIGASGLIRFGLLLFPQIMKEWAMVFAVLGVIQLLYGAILAAVQTDFRHVLAYFSFSQMGLVLLGIASLNDVGMQGLMLQLISHGLIIALLLLLTGSLQERTGTTVLAELGGLSSSLPFMSGILLTASLAATGIPGFSGFVSEFLILAGLSQSMKVLAAIAIIGIILAAVYILRGVLAVNFGPKQERFGALNDARLIEALPMMLLLSFIVLLGIYPSILLEPIKVSLNEVTAQLSMRAGG